VDGAGKGGVRSELLICDRFLEERWPYLSAEQKMQLEGAVDQIRAGSNMARRILMKVAEEGAA
jgi:hypothetical protein